MRVVVLCLVSSFCIAQTAFDVASIKPNLSGAEGGSIRLTPGGRLVAQNASLRQLITAAYDVRDFQLKVHREKRELPIYRLIVAKGGSKLQPAKAVCTPMIPPPTKFDPATLRPCGGFNNNIGMMLGGAVSTAKLGSALSRILGRTVVDKTELNGSYDISLHWTPDDAQAPAADLADPSFFTALQEQLGLRLESGRGPVEVLVVDQSEKPSEN